MRRALPVIAAASLSLLVAGCAPSNQEAIAAQGITQSRADDPKIPTGDGGQVSLEAGDLYFDDLSGTALQGEVQFVVDNVGGQHNIVIDQAAGEQQKIDLPAGQETEGTLLLYGSTAGSEYTYYCDIPGHRAAGMVGTLTVFLDQASADAAGADMGDAGDADGEQTDGSDTEG